MIWSLTFNREILLLFSIYNVKVYNKDWWTLITDINAPVNIVHAM